jgi:hypothetical protein
MRHLAHLSVESRRRRAAERKQAEEAAAPRTVPGGGASWAELLRIAYTNGSAAALGLPVTHEELDALLALEGEGAAGDSRSPRFGGYRESVSSDEATSTPHDSKRSRSPSKPSQGSRGTRTPVPPLQAQGTVGNGDPGAYERQVADAYRKARAEMGLDPDGGNRDNAVAEALRYVEDWQL